MSDMREKIEAERQQERTDFCRLLRNTVRKMAQSTLDRPSFGRVPMPDEILDGLDDEYSLLGSLDPTKIGRDPQKLTSEINEYGRQLREILRKVNAKMHEIGDDARPYSDVDCDYNLATRKIVIHASIYICRPRNG